MRKAKKKGKRPWTPVIETKLGTHTKRSAMSVARGRWGVAERGCLPQDHTEEPTNVGLTPTGGQDEVTLKGDRNGQILACACACSQSKITEAHTACQGEAHSRATEIAAEKQLHTMPEQSYPEEGVKRELGLERRGPPHIEIGRL